MASYPLDEIRQSLEGKWKVVRSENFEEYLRESGVNFFFRKLASMVSPTMIISVSDDGQIKIEMIIGFMTQEEKFKLDVEHEKNHMKFRMKSIHSWDSGKLVNKMTPLASGIKPQTLTRELQGEELMLTMEIDDIKCRRFLKRLPN